MVLKRCQLWVATHSAGILRSSLENTDETATFDGSNIDVDRPCKLSPISKNARTALRRLYHVALDDLANLVLAKNIIDPECVRARLDDLRQVVPQAVR